MKFTAKQKLLLLIQFIYRTPMCITWTLAVHAVWSVLWLPDFLLGWNINFWWLSGWQYLLFLPTPAMVLVPLALKFGVGKITHIPKSVFIPLKPYLCWMETPDQHLPGDVQIPIVAKIFTKYNFFWCSYYWLAWRNVGQGILWPEAVPAPDYWHNLTEEHKKEMGWYRRAYDFFGLRLRIGHWIYPNPYKVKFDSEFVAVPHITLRRAK